MSEKVTKRICVAKNAKNDTQKGLCCKNKTQKIVWHPANEVPQFPDGSDVVKLAVLDRPKKYDRLHHGYFYREQDWKQEVIENRVQRWAYFDELMSL